VSFGEKNNSNLKEKKRAEFSETGKFSPKEEKH
jgi:hypothetical protein